jgi:FkbM family methyltransferase
MLQLTDTLRGRFLCYDTDRYVGASLIGLGEFMEAQARLFDLLLKPSAVVVEVGANIGAHTVVLAKKAAKVHAFEPQRRLYNVLCANMALNALDNVECYRAAGGEAHALAEIPAVDFEERGNNHGAFSIEVGGSAADTVEVLPITVPCDFLKVDVEGYEARVLRGAEPMIRECAPVLYVENDRAENSAELVGLIKGMGYKAYWHITPAFRVDNFRGAAVDPFDGAHSFDMLCLPQGIAFDKLPEVSMGGEHPAMGRH